MPAMTITFDMDLKIGSRTAPLAAPASRYDNAVYNDDLASAKGIVFGSLLGLAIWTPVVAYFFS